jgi:hypothetical protein
MGAYDKVQGRLEYICPTIDDLTPDQLEAIKTNCPSARIGEDGLVYPFHYIKEYYDERARYPKTDARNQILKLGINGVWGKRRNLLVDAKEYHLQAHRHGTPELSLRNPGEMCSSCVKRSVEYHSFRH